jgi:hypothetical protein
MGPVDDAANVLSNLLTVAGLFGTSNGENLYSQANWTPRRKRLAAVYMTLAAAVAGDFQRDEVDFKAISVIVAALEYLAAGPNHAIPRTKIETAYRSFGLDRLLTEHLAKLVDAWVLAGRDSPAQLVGLVERVARQHAKPVADLVRMLEHHHVARGSGPVPKGRYTTAMVVAWLTGDATKAKLVASTRRKARRSHH